MPSPKRDVLLVGAGKMGCALMQGWLDQGIVAGIRSTVLEPAPSDELQAMANANGLTLVSHADEVSEESFRAVVLAVKPQVMDEVLPGLRCLVGDATLFLSIAAGKSLNVLRGGLGSGARIARAMPNTPAAIGLGATGLYMPDTLSDEQKSYSQSLLKAVGGVVLVEDEDQIDAVTAVSGSGPAYVFYMIEALTAAGVEVGLNKDVAQQLATATMQGAGHLAARSGETPATLRQNVTSPGGTTAAALEVLMSDKGLSPLMRDAVKAAYQRAKELNA